jgi:hypothetical protein
MPAVTPGLAARHAAHGQIAAGGRAVLLQRLHRVSGTGGLETAGAAQHRADQQLVGPHQPHQRALVIIMPLAAASPASG